MWRSLVSRLVRVQEAPGSNPGTPTKIPVTTSVVTGIFIVPGFERTAPVHSLVQKVSGGLFLRSKENPLLSGRTPFVDKTKHVS